MEILDHSPHGLVVMDGQKRVAKARPVAQGFWMLRRYGTDWDDPRAGTNPEKFGKRMNKNLLCVKGKAEARKVLQNLVKQLDEVIDA